MDGPRIERVFLGWPTRLLRTAAVALRERFNDLARVLIVTTGSGAARELQLEINAAIGSSTNTPRCVTVSSLLDALLPPTKRTAGKGLRLMAWERALRTISPERLARAFGAVGSGREATRRLAALLESVKHTLGAEGLTIADASVAIRDRGDQWERWEVMAELEELMVAALDGVGVRDADHERAVSLNTGRIRRIGDVSLVCVPELPAAAKRALVAGASRITPLVGATSDMSRMFDEFGCVIPSEWMSHHGAAQRAQVRIVNSPSDQCDAALEAIANENGRYGAKEILIGVPDTSIVAPLQERARRCGARVRHGAGGTVTMLGVDAFFAATEAFVETRSFRAFGTLVRHPAAHDFVSGRVLRAGDETPWLAEIDSYSIDHLPRSIDDGADQWRGSPARASVLESVRLSIWELLGGVLERDSERSLREWGEELLGVLRRLHDATSHREPPDLAGFIRAAEELTGVQGSVRLSAGDAIRVLRASVVNTNVPPEPDAGAIEAVGWLELAFDPAPMAVVLSVNEGILPRTSDASDSLLTPTTRAVLGLPGKDERAARDVYLLTLLGQTKERLTLIAARRDRSGEPLIPSRLLFACADDEVTRRAGIWADEAGSHARRRPPEPTPGPGTTSGFTIMPRVDLPTVESMGVTSFKDYLSSPYLFYLKHVARLTEFEEPTGELDAGMFGSLLHDCLMDLGRSPARGSTSEKEILDFLASRLEKRSTDLFGPSRPVSISLQLRMAMGRLRGFAGWQAQRARQGWVISHAEWSADTSGQRVVFRHGGVEMPLRGRIDRIDRHPQFGFALLDYKTQSTGTEPAKTHRSRSGWKDLQLPLYRHLAAGIIGGQPVTMGYVSMPQDAERVRLLEANWSTEDLASADDAAADVVRRVLKADFFDAGPRPEQHGIFGALLGLAHIGHVEGGSDPDAPPADHAERSLD